jgi:hypothetical protein
MEGDNDNFDLFDFWFDIVNIGGANIKFEMRCQLNKKSQIFLVTCSRGQKWGSFILRIAIVAQDGASIRPY